MISTLKSAEKEAFKVVFLDRDGVINRDSPAYIKSVSEFEFLPGSLEALARLTRRGFALIVLTNQSVVNRGIISLGDLEAIHNHMRKTVAAHGGRIDDVFFCPHTPGEGCNCRKPASGLLDQAQTRYGMDLKDTYLVGDSAKDIECAHNAGCGHAILVRTGNGTQAEGLLAGTGSLPDYVAADLNDAATWIISHEAARVGGPQRP